MKLNLTNIASYPVPLRLVVFVLVLLLLWLPIAAPIDWLLADQNLVSILTIPLLYGEFILLLRWWGKHVYCQPNLFQKYGLVGTRRNGQQLLLGLGIGVASVTGLFLVEGWLGWLEWQQPQTIRRFIVEGLVVALGYGFAEELLFRGWLLDELQRDYCPVIALWTNASLFAMLHFIKPLSEVVRTLPQFPALLLLGLTLVWAKQCAKGLLGLPIGIHDGLVWGYYTINVGQMVQYSDRVSEWVTGVDRNPLAGGMGLLFLSAIALGIQILSRSNTQAQ